MELEGFRKDAARLGFAEADQATGLESVEDFIARMKGADDTTTPPDLSRFRRRRRLTSILVAAVAASVVAVVVLRPGASPVVADTPPVLDYEYSAAVRIAFAPGEPIGPSVNVLADAARGSTDRAGEGPIQYHVSENWFSDQDEAGGSVITPRVTETWLRPDGSLVSLDTVGAQLRSDGRGLSTGAPTYSSDPETSELPAGTVDADFVDSLSTDPVRLRSQLLERAGCRDFAEPSDSRSLCLYDEIRALFATYVVKPDLAAATWEALRGEEGFTSLGSVEDRAGRNGLAISLISSERPEYRFVLIGSTETGQLLGTEEILIKQAAGLDIDPPAVISFTAITSSERVASIPDALR